MKFSFLTEDNLLDRYGESKRYTELLTEPFKEFERIARNRPRDNSDPKLPRVTDGTTASIVRKTPKRVVQQLPTGVIESDDDNSWLPIVASFIYLNKIIPYANEDYDLIQKCWNQIERGLTFGYGVSYTPFLNHDGYFCTDMTLPYWGDVFIQPGKKSGKASSYVFLRSWWQKEDLEALIKQEQDLAKKAKKRGETYEPSWDIEAMKAAIDSKTLKDEKASTPSETERSVSPSGIEIVTGFQDGIGSTFYTFCPVAGADKKHILRRKKNRDPRGKKPLDWFYGDIDGTNPLGRGIVELVGGLQNLIDSDMQMYQWNRALMLAPPVIKRGNFSKSKIVYEPNRIIDVGTDPGATVEPLKIDSTAVQKYPELYGLQKSQLLNLVNSPDTSISADVGNPGFSRTPEGLKQQQAVISVDDNYIRKMFEKWFEDWSETAINLYFAERSGKEELQLDDKTAKKLRELEQKGDLDAGFVDEDNKITIDYDTATPALKFRVDASTSKMKSDQDQLLALNGLLETLESNPVLASVVPPEKIIGAWNKIVDASGVEDPEELSIDVEEFKKQQLEARQNPQPNPETAQAEEKLKQEQIKTEQQGLKLEQDQLKVEQQAAQTATTQPVPLAQDTTSEDEQITAQLTALGVAPELINYALQLLDQGVAADEVLAEVLR